MLIMNLKDYGDGTYNVESVTTEDGTVITQFDPEKGRIDLGVLAPFVHSTIQKVTNGQKTGLFKLTGVSYDEKTQGHIITLEELE